MSLRARAGWVLAIALAAGAPQARCQDADPAAPDDVRLELQIEALRASDEATRTEALRRLAEVAVRRPQDLEPFLHHADPDVRFQVLYLLSERDARAEQRVRQIVEGRPALAPTYPQALEARVALLQDALREAREEGAPRRAVERLACLARRRAGGGDLGTRYAMVALDLVRDVLAQTPLLGEPAREVAVVLTTLTAVDLGEAFNELCACFMALPPEAAHGALREVIGGGAPITQARAARVLGEITDPGRAELAAAAVRPLLGHALPEVRLAALRALSVMPLGDEALLHAGVLARDGDAFVAEEALRLAGERRLGFVREAAQRVAVDRRAALQVRRQAIRTLGLLGNPAAAAALDSLIGPTQDRELRVLAAWALGAVRAPDARETIARLLEAPELLGDERLFAGLARLGPEGVEALGAMLAPGSGAGRARRIRAIKALGRSASDSDPRGAAAATTLLVALSKRPLAQTLGDDGAVTENELKLSLRSLGDLAHGSEEARSAVASMVLQRRDVSLLDALLPVIAEVGPPLEPTQALALRDDLARLVLQLGGSGRTAAAAALLRVDPARAREVLASLVGETTAVVGRARNEDALDLMRLLARAGDPGPVRQIAVRLAREQLEQDSERADRRFGQQNRLGIELLYAGEWDEAILEFRRMLWCRADDDVSSYNVACGHALAGRVDAALLALRRSVRNGYRNPLHMAADPDLDSVRADGRFQRLLSRLRLEDETGVRLTDDTWPRRLVPE